MMPTDRVSGHAFSHPPDIVGGLVDNRLRRVSAAAEATDDRHSFLSGTALRCMPLLCPSPDCVRG